MAAPLSIKGQNTIPMLWRGRILKREFGIVLGKMLQPAQVNPDETEEPYLRSANVQWEGIDLSDIKTMWFSSKEKKILLLKSGDLLVNEGGDVGRCAVWTGGIETCFFQNAINRVRPLRKASTHFLYYWLYNIKQAGFIDAIVSRTTIAHLTAEKLEAVPWPDAPPDEQQKIAAYLDKTCAAIDAAIEKKQKQLETLDALRKSIIHKAVTRGIDDSVELKDSGVEWIGKIPISWKVTRLKNLARIRYGLGQPPHEQQDGIPMIRATNIDAGRILQEGLLRVDPDALPLEREPYLQKDDIIVVRSGAYTGDSAIIPQKYSGAVAGYDLVVTVKKADPKFISYSLLSRYVLDSQLLLMTLRAAQPHLNAEELGSIIIVLPGTVKEQQEIALHIKNKLEQIDKGQNILSSQITTLEQYRKSLIHECVTGKRRIAEDDLQVIHQY